jgi:hypothetical protein
MPPAHAPRSCPGNDVGFKVLRRMGWPRIAQTEPVNGRDGTRRLSIGLASGRGRFASNPTNGLCPWPAWNHCGVGPLLAKMGRPPWRPAVHPRETVLVRVAPFHAFDEAHKPPVQRIYHDNDACPLARAIPERGRRPGTGGHRLCKECDRLDRAAGGRSSPWL